MFPSSLYPTSMFPRSMFPGAFGAVVIVVQPDPSETIFVLTPNIPDPSETIFVID